MTQAQSWEPPELEVDPSKPLYEQFAAVIRVDIARGRLRPGDRMPSVRDLAGKWRVNPNTVMRTYRDLEHANFIITQRGQGTFVAKNASVIEKSKRAIAVQAWQQLMEVAASVGMTAEELIRLANETEVSSRHE